MRDFLITTDYTCDLPENFFSENNIERLIMPFTQNGIEYDIKNKSIPYHDFYQKMREGSGVQTSQVSQYDAKEQFSRILEQNMDVLHISFSSGVSASYENFAPTVKELKMLYPEGNVVVIDSLAGSGGLGLMLYYANKMKQQGKSLQEVASYLEENKLNFNHYFIVDDLQHLKRGGRVNAIEATLGTILGIKPILALDIHGKISAIAKVRGFKKAYSNMVERTLKEIDIAKNDFLIVVHADNLNYGMEVGEKLKAATGLNIEYLNLSYLIGGHTGADTSGIFFIGKKRDF